jgi:hypothetical protein
MLPFLSRRIPTAAQIETVRASFGELVLPECPAFEPGRVVEQVTLAALPHLDMDALPEPVSAGGLIFRPDDFAPGEATS